MRFQIILTTMLMTAGLAACTSPSVSHMSTKKSCNVACSLSPQQLHKLRDGLLPGLFQRADKVTDIPNGFRLRFQPRAGLLAEMTRIIGQEQVCCSFLRFQLTIEPGSGPVTFEVSGPPGTREMLKAL